MKLSTITSHDQRTAASKSVQKFHSSYIGMSVPGGSTTCFASSSCTCTCGVIAE